jgi:hypothetical protein
VVLPRIMLQFCGDTLRNGWTFRAAHFLEELALDRN